jgi:hypothetical protein
LKYQGGLVGTAIASTTLFPPDRIQEINMRKTQLALALAACAAGPTYTHVALAQSQTPQASAATSCAAGNYDSTRNLFTITNPGSGPGTVNQQCFITVSERGMPADPASGRFVAGSYEILLSGGGGGGGGGSRIEGGGGGGAGAVPQRIVRYLGPGTYRITIGRGGLGGQACQTAANGGAGREGAPSSMQNTDNGITVAGFEGAASWTGMSPYAVASSRGIPPQSMTSSARPGEGGTALTGQSSGGAGGRAAGGDHRASSGSWLSDVAYSGHPGAGGYGTAVDDGVALEGGGGGGAGYGNGGNGQSMGHHETVATTGELGGGGGGGGGGRGVCGDGASGGEGFVKMTLVQAAQ